MTVFKTPEQFFIYPAIGFVEQNDEVHIVISLFQYGISFKLFEK